MHSSSMLGRIFWLYAYGLVARCYVATLCLQVDYWMDVALASHLLEYFCRKEFA